MAKMQTETAINVKLLFIEYFMKLKEDFFDDAKFIFLQNFIQTYQTIYS